jgi:hypothetical protein
MDSEGLLSEQESAFAGKGGDTMTEKKSCSFAGFHYPKDSKICKSGKCMKCDNGQWKDTGRKCPC